MGSGPQPARGAGPRHALVEHASEVELQIEAATLPALFEEAGRALAELMAGATAPDEEPPETVTVHARDVEALLVEWLNELVARADEKKRVYPAPRVEALGNTSLTATLRGASPTAARTAVKAATFHRLRVAPLDGGYRAQVVLDV